MSKDGFASVSRSIQRPPIIGWPFFLQLLLIYDPEVGVVVGGVVVVPEPVVGGSCSKLLRPDVIWAADAVTVLVAELIFAVFVLI